MKSKNEFIYTFGQTKERKSLNLALAHISVATYSKEETKVRDYE